MTQVKGVPAGWELVGFYAPKKGEFVIDTDGTPYEVAHADVGEVLPVIRKVAPVCTWPHGVFADGWIAEDESGDQYWYNSRPDSDGDDEWGNGDDCHYIGEFLIQIPFRADLPWDERIQQVGPTIEAKLKGGA